MSHAEEKLFPQPYMGPGSNGPAVLVLQTWLSILNPKFKIIPDGYYGRETARGVATFQYIVELDVEGHFGPATREAWKEMYGFHPNDLPRMGVPETTVPPTSADTYVIGKGDIGIE
jgi:peptidoglycan hydrolase-like protein with peptidoglycan-binding domain